LFCRCDLATCKEIICGSRRSRRDAGGLVSLDISCGCEAISREAPIALGSNCLPPRFTDRTSDFKSSQS
jgi:hypothetical protein